MGNGKCLAVASVCALLSGAPATAVLINFDTDGSGNPIVAPTLFAQTTPLRDAYAAIGVNFSGPSALDGGAILSGGGFGVQPRSAPNFVAFSRSATAFMQNGGLPRDPETITFNTPLSSASIYASGGGQAATFRLDALDGGGGLITSATGSNVGGQYVQLVIAPQATPISRLVLTEIGGDSAFVYDDLEFTVIPEPAGVGAGALALAAGSLARRRRRRR
jgi:hypothetical protein